MSEEIKLSENELDALLGDALSKKDSRENKDALDAFRDIIKKTLPEVKNSLSRSLGQEIELQVTFIENTKGIAIDGSDDWYVATGSFSNNGFCEHVFVFPPDLAQEMVAQFTGVADVKNEPDQIVAPLTELSQELIKVFENTFGDNYTGTVGDFVLQSDLTSLSNDTNFIKVGWQTGTNTFYQFFNTAILDMIAPGGETSSPQEELADLGSLDDYSDVDVSETIDNEDEEETSSEDTAQGKDSDMLAALSDPQDDSDSLSSASSSKLFGAMTSSEDESLSLGDALLGAQAQTVSNVSMPNLEEDAASASYSNSLSMLMDITMDITVELGSTKKLIGEILELNRGSIIELKKLAGEPLDIKINNKLIAKGEVVVIDEYFGVRIIEVVSPNERVKK